MTDKSTFTGAKERLAGVDDNAMGVESFKNSLEVLFTGTGNKDIVNVGVG